MLHGNFILLVNFYWLGNATANEPQHTDAYRQLYFILLREWIKDIEDL